MTRHLLMVLTLVVAAGCSSMPTLPYYPAHQPPGATVSAAWQLAGNQLRMEIDTGHRRLEEALIVKADGTTVRAQAIEVAPSVTTSSPVGVGIGIGGGSYGSGGGVGTGVDIGFPVGGTTTVTEGNTFAVFPADEAGPPPWRLNLRLAGTEPLEIRVGPGAGWVR